MPYIHTFGIFFSVKSKEKDPLKIPGKELRQALINRFGNYFYSITDEEFEEMCVSEESELLEIP
jgi:hypothetical protein